MAHESAPPKTRIWWDDSEVQFIRWSDKSLVFSWGGTTETAVHLSRGAVVRLLQNGVLRIEGSQPEWVHDQPEADRVSEYRPVTHQPRRTAPYFEPIILDLPPEPVEFVPPVPAAPQEEPAHRFKLITRLIRKLTGGGQG